MMTETPAIQEARAHWHLRRSYRESLESQARTAQPGGLLQRLYNLACEADTNALITLQTALITRH